MKYTFFIVWLWISAGITTLTGCSKAPVISTNTNQEVYLPTKSVAENIAANPATSKFFDALSVASLRAILSSSGPFRVLFR